MQNLISKIETQFTTWLEGFEKNPIQKGIKLLFMLWVVRWVYKNFFKDFND